MTIETLSSDKETLDLCNLFLNLPFNRVIGLKLESIQHPYLSLCFSMKPELIGNTFKKVLHGGVIASAMDACAGLHALAISAQKINHVSHEEKARRLSKSGTIDMRVDYLTPGKGSTFVVQSELLRSGRRVTVLRTKLFNENDTLIAAASASYLMECDLSVE